MKRFDKKMFGKAVFIARNALKLTIAELAEMIGVARSTVWRIETNENASVDVDTMYALVDALNLDFEMFYSNEVEE